MTTCPKCGASMTLLLTSFVCDRCDPPADPEGKYILCQVDAIALDSYRDSSSTIYYFSSSYRMCDRVKLWAEGRDYAVVMTLIRVHPGAISPGNMWHVTKCIINN